MSLSTALSSPTRSLTSRLPAEDREHLGSPQIPGIAHVTPKPSFDEVVAAVVAESHYTPSRATAFVKHMRYVCQQIRLHGGAYHPSTWQLGQYHAIMEKVMPDDAEAAPGSAHDLLNAYLLEDEEMAIVHTRSRNRRYHNNLIGCAVALRLKAII